VHVRRDFIKIFDGIPKLRSWARKWLFDIAQLFVLNHKRFALWSEGKDLGKAYRSAQAELTKHVEYLQGCWLSQLRKTSHPEQKTVLNSLKNHWTGLTLFLKDSSHSSR